MNELAAVDYLLENHPKWRKTYGLFNNHEAAMTIVARDLSANCGLTVYADRIWVGGGCIGLGMVFMDESMGDEVHAPEDDEKLKKLEERLVELKLVNSTPILEVLCSSTYLPHREEPLHMRMRSPPNRPSSGEDIIQRTKYWKEEHKRRRQSERKARRSEGEGARAR